ncbi:MAG: alpha/beta hydrolase [Flavobacteriaceae bacterium]|jgi:pimeloyl-ACP methyl ester carboxylesterase|nr:alpha/beta hydrolase [Flavobacteriaceae bacterium]MBT3920456.1 alpha/beta hydrolase [Flavobacteriaceae bacterium]MBT6706174.1 alpha/beta hydrolase [Flavobacteriaceae bacterium]
MMINKNLLLPRKGKKTIAYDVFYKADNIPKPVVIFCHGYKGYKDWGAWNLVAERFAEEGCFFLKFNFSHNGGTPNNPIDFPDLDAFAQNNFTKELDDLEDILNFISTTDSFGNELNQNHISLIAHSRAAGIILIKASEKSRVKNVITWAGVSDFKARFQIGSSQFNDWKEKGITYIENSRTKQLMPHYFQFFQDFSANENRLTIKLAVKKLNIPLLVVQGSDDTTVIEAEASLLHQWSPKSELEIIKNGDHSFGTIHPWKERELPKDLHKVVEKSIAFLKKVN